HRWLLVGRHGAEDTVALVVGAGGEVQGRERPRTGAVPEADAPQAIDHQRVVVGGLEVAARLPCRARPREGVDPAVAEVADEEVATELAEAGMSLAVGRRRPRQTPRRVE